jgi:hypothetical protein
MTHGCKSFLFIVALIFTPFLLFAKSDKKKKDRTRSWYLSWGYNEEWYTRSSVHIKQDALGNDYTMEHVYAHNHKGWDHHLFQQQLTIPQYNYRLGCYINKKQDIAIELNFDHTKYIITDNQYIHMKGTYNHAAMDGNVLFSQTNGFYYYLNNGANFFLINLVKRLELYRTKHNDFRLDFTGKVGIGPVVPHVQNSLFGQANTPHFQFGGWNTGAETAVRATIMRYAYLEFSQKVDYARYSNLKIYEGTAKQNFGTYELILSLGVTLPTHKGNPLFTH